MVFTLSNLLIGDGGARIKDSGTALSSVGGVSCKTDNITSFYMNPNVTQDIVYTHNLGKIPTNIQFFGSMVYPSLTHFHGNYNSNGKIFCYTDKSSSNSTSYSIYIYNGLNDFMRGNVSAVSTTTFTITWTTGSSWTNYEVYFSWIAIA